MKKAQDISLTPKNLDISVVGLDTKFKKLNEKDLEKYFDNSGMVIDD